jgi:beta-lactamase superfamily II metal-dependent hydrolase
VLVAPHHGSANSQNLEFLLATSPEVVIQSPGLGSEEAPTQDTSDKLEFTGVQQIVNTASEGTALLVTDGHMYTIKTDETNRTITIPEFNNIQIIFVIAMGIILIPILIIQYSKKPMCTK